MRRVWGFWFCFGGVWFLVCGVYHVRPADVLECRDELLEKRHLRVQGLGFSTRLVPHR